MPRPKAIAPPTAVITPSAASVSVNPERTERRRWPEQRWHRTIGTSSTRRIVRRPIMKSAIRIDGPIVIVISPSGRLVRPIVIVISPTGRLVRAREADQCRRLVERCAQRSVRPDAAPPRGFSTIRNHRQRAHRQLNLQL